MMEESRSLEHTPTWVVAVICFVIVLISLVAERGLHRLGKLLKHKDQDALFRALEKLKEDVIFQTVLWLNHKGRLHHSTIRIYKGIAHCPTIPHFDFYKYMMRTLEIDFKRIVGIRYNYYTTFLH
ncbi:hypothetical protein C3L33_21344, partial [Rhododendron williamsianum]